MGNNDDVVFGRSFEQHAGKIITTLLSTAIVGGFVMFVQMRDGVRDNTSTNASQTQDIASLEQRVDTVRIDPFTGSEGKELERRVSTIEAQNQLILERFDDLKSTLASIQRSVDGRP